MTQMTEMKARAERGRGRVGILFSVEWASFLGSSGHPFASNTNGVRSAGPLQKGSRGVEWASSEFCDPDFKSKLGLSSRGVSCVWCLGNGSLNTLNSKNPEP